MINNLKELKIACSIKNKDYFLYIEEPFAELTESEDFNIMLYLYGKSESLFRLFFNTKGCYLSSFFTTRLYLPTIDENTLDLFLEMLKNKELKYKNIPLKILSEKIC